MLKLILTSSILLGICILGMAVKILFHKSHKFPETEVGHNAEMRKRGITCPKHDDLKCWKKSTNCASCMENSNS